MTTVEERKQCKAPDRPAGSLVFEHTQPEFGGLSRCAALPEQLVLSEKTVRWDSSNMLSKFYLEEWMQGAGLSGICLTVEFQLLAYYAGVSCKEETHRVIDNVVSFERAERAKVLPRWAGLLLIIGVLLNIVDAP